MENSQTSTMKVCIIQPYITEDYEMNCENISKYSHSSVKIHSPDLVVLPEFWINSNEEKLFSLAEKEEISKSLAFLKNLSKELNTFLIGGSIPELENSKVYNTCYCFDNKGNIIAKHRQAHFINHNKNFSSGDSFTICKTPFANIGIGLGEDLRFMEYSQILKKKGCNLIVIPTSYHKYEEYDNYKIITQGRSLDNNIYLITSCPYYKDKENKLSGYSQIVNPYGEIIINSSNQEGIIMGVIDFSIIDKIQDSIPTLKQKRFDLYELISLS